MAALILINGPPASGKSTLAELLVSTRPLALDLDVDVIRGLLGQWLEHPPHAGLAARRLAVVMARVHLEGDRDVVVPQFLARADFIIDLEQVASERGATFVEVALIVSREETMASFTARSAAPQTNTHRDAQGIVDRMGGEPALEEMHDAYMRLIDSRPSAIRVDVVRGDIDETHRRLELAIEQRLGSRS